MEDSGIDIDESQRQQQKQKQQEEEEEQQIRHVQILEQGKEVPLHRHRHERINEPLAKSLFLVKQIPELLRYLLPTFYIVATTALLSYFK